MFKLIVTALALAVFGVNGRPYGEENLIFECNGKPDGYYADVSDPTAFFSCHGGTLLAKVICEDGFLYDGEESCIPVVTEVENGMEEVEEDKDMDNNLGHLFPPSDDDDDDDDDDDNDDDDQVRGMSKKKIFNIEITKNIFPRSIIIIGKANREQKNK